MFQYDELIAAGFTGFKTVKQMNNGGLSSVTEAQGVYMILYLSSSGEMPKFLPVGTGGFFKGEDPNVSIAELQNNWVEGTPVVYIGKATSIKKRLYQYMRNYLEIIMTISSALALRSGSEENLEKKQKLWQYLKEKDRTLYYWMRRGIMGEAMNLPGKLGRNIAVESYKVCQKIFKFN